MALSSSAAFAAYPSASFGVKPQSPVSTYNRQAVGTSVASPAALPTTSASSVLTGFACGLAVAGAAKTQRKARTVRLAGEFNPSGALGALKPVDYWDPCGLMKDGMGNWKDQETFDKYRTAELKHGRVAMLAMTGILTAFVWKFPGWESVPNGFAAFTEEKGGAGFGLIVILAALVEFNTPKGDFQDPLGVGSFKQWGYCDDMKNKELNHGRMAMAAIITTFLCEYGTQETPSTLFEYTFGQRGANTFAGPVLAAIAALALILPVTPYGPSKSKDEQDKPDEALSAAVGWLWEADFGKDSIPAIAAPVKKTAAKVDA